MPYLCVYLKETIKIVDEGKGYAVKCVYTNGHFRGGVYGGNYGKVDYQASRNKAEP